MALILDGAPVRDAIYKQCRPRIAALQRPPGLAVVLVGHDPGSEIYVRKKVQASQELGIHSETLKPPDSISTADLLAVVGELNDRPEIDAERRRHPGDVDVVLDAATKIRELTRSGRVLIRREVRRR